MSGLKGITINTDPAAEAHVYAEDDAAIYQSIFGSDGVLTIGQQCESQVISNNKVRVKDGVIVVGGHIARIPYGDYCDCEIANGQSGKNRNDIIIAKFVSTGTGGIDTMACEVKQGTATTDTATDPVLTQEDLYESGKIREMPLYRVKIEGLSIVGVEPMFDIVPTIPTLNANLSQLSSKMTDIILRKSKTNRINVAAGQRSVSGIILDAIEGYTPLESLVWSSHSTTITSDCHIDNDRVTFYFDAKSAQTPETFTAETIYVKNTVISNSP